MKFLPQIFKLKGKMKVQAIRTEKQNSKINWKSKNQFKLDIQTTIKIV